MTREKFVHLVFVGISCSVGNSVHLTEFFSGFHLYAVGISHSPRNLLREFSLEPTTKKALDEKGYVCPVNLLLLEVKQIKYYMQKKISFDILEQDFSKFHVPLLDFQLNGDAL